MNANTDLFGEPITATPAKRFAARGYAAPPGTGPAGKTCRDCDNYARRRSAKTYLKCWLMRDVWTGGPGTDIKAKSPACRFFNKQSITT